MKSKVTTQAGEIYQNCLKYKNQAQYSNKKFLHSKFQVENTILHKTEGNKRNGEVEKEVKHTTPDESTYSSCIWQQKVHDAENKQE